MIRVELPDGAWAELQDPRKVPERARRPVLTAQAGLQQYVTGETLTTSPAALQAFSELNDAMAVALVERWSYPDPVSLDGVLGLPGDAYDALREAVAPFATALLPDFSPSTDKGSPTSA